MNANKFSHFYNFNAKNIDFISKNVAHTVGPLDHCSTYYGKDWGCLNAR